MDLAWGIGAAVAVIGGGLCCWVWRARRSGGARDSVAGYLIGDQIAGGGHFHHSDHHHDSGGGWGDGGGADGGANA